MKIASSQVVLQAASQHSVTATKLQSLTIGGRQLQGIKLPQDVLDISPQLRTLNSIAEQQAQRQISLAASPSDPLQLSDKDRSKLELLDRMIEMLTGKKLKVIVPASVKLSTDTSQPIQLQLRPAFSLQYDAWQTTTESQSLQFSAQGVVTTADGRRLDFSAQLNMSRSFVQTSKQHLRIGTQMDPLVLNFSGTPMLGERNFRFDLDSDGTADQIAFVGQGSGFLALDKNGDGVINDGSELFGPNSGDGFAELAAYDVDDNGWIDENDAIYDKLRIWAVDESGNKTLFALGQKGVGAIFLGNVRGNFDLKDSTNATLGTVRSTGVFLTEAGGVGTIQHIDLTL